MALSAGCAGRHPGADPTHARGQPSLGRAAHPRRLQKLGLTVSQSTVAKYLGRRDGPPSQTWRTFLINHVSQLASVDFFTVPTATFRGLFVFVIRDRDGIYGPELHNVAHAMDIDEILTAPRSPWLHTRLRSSGMARTANPSPLHSQREPGREPANHVLSAADEVG